MGMEHESSACGPFWVAGLFYAHVDLSSHAISGFVNGFLLHTRCAPDSRPQHNSKLISSCVNCALFWRPIPSRWCPFWWGPDLFQKDASDLLILRMYLKFKIKALPSRYVLARHPRKRLAHGLDASLGLRGSFPAKSS